jgi:putative serine protease PepD
MPWGARAEGRDLGENVLVTTPDDDWAPIRPAESPAAPAQVSAPVATQPLTAAPVAPDPRHSPSPETAAAPSSSAGPVDHVVPATEPRSAQRRTGVAAGVVVLLMVVSLLLGALLGVFGARWLLPDATPTGLPTADADGDPVRDVELDPVGNTWISEIAALALPSTVYIEVRAGEDSVSGSGFVVREDGYIVTNEHVISAARDGAGEITVVFSDGSEEAAEIVGSTADYDLAVLRIDRDGLAPLVLGDSDTLVVGDPVIAVGAPLGLSGSVTAGIVSAVERPVTVRSPDAAGDDPSSYINAIQTDAAINRGNSGGPLLDAAGQVIGVNTAVARDASSGGGGNEPGFAIPSNQVRHTVEQIIELGHATYPVVGVVLDPEYTGEGVAVRTDEINGTPPVAPGGPADQAGIQPGDVIVSVDGDPVSDPTDLIVRVRSHLPGETMVLTLRTGDDERDVEVVLGEEISE